MNKNAYAKEESGQNLPVCALRGLLTAVLAVLAVAAACSFIGLGMEDPGKYTKIFAFASLFTASFAGGFSAARAKGSATLACGALTGAFVLALIAVLSLCFSLSLNIPLFALCAPCVLLCSVLGANVGVGARGGKKKKKHGKNRV